MIEILEPGLSTTVQDTGRFGHYHIGMPPAGAMDQFAHKVANALVGNPADAATLEMTYLGSDLTVEDDTVVAVTGAEMSPTIGGEDVEMWTAHEVTAGETISMGGATEGVRSYLAVSGGIDVTPIMGSRSTYTLIGLGGYEGRELEEGDRLPVGTASGAASLAGTSVPDAHRPDYADDGAIRVVMGLCDYRLSDDGRESFLEAEWQVSDEADRVGTRFDGPDIEPMFKDREPPFGAGTDITNIVDVGYPIGSIQMAGQPIILMADAVTGGGYATVGTVISPDRDRLAQRRTHRTVTFSAVDIDEAIAAREEREETLDTIRSAIGGSS